MQNTAPPTTRKVPDWKDVNVLHDLKDKIIKERLNGLHLSIREIIFKVVYREYPGLKRAKIPADLYKLVEDQLSQCEHRVRELLRKEEAEPKVVREKVPAAELAKHYSAEDISAALGQILFEQASRAIRNQFAGPAGPSAQNGRTEPAKPKHRVLLAGFLPEQARELEKLVEGELAAGPVKLEVVSLEKNADVTAKHLPERVDQWIYMEKISHPGFNRLKQKYGGNGHRAHGLTQAANHLRTIHAKLVGEYNEHENVSRL